MVLELAQLLTAQWGAASRTQLTGNFGFFTVFFCWFGELSWPSLER